MSKVFEIAFKLGGELTSSFKKAFSQAEGAIKLVGAAAAAIGGTAALTSVASQVLEMNDSFTQLSAQTGIFGDDLEALKGTAENLFRNNYGENFNEITEALANVKQNMHELNDVDLEKFTGDALMFTKTFEADLNEVTRAANNMMSAFGIESSKAMDLFAAGAQRGLNFSDEMLDNVAEYAPLFGAMGYSAEEYFGILERGAQAGVYNLDYVNDVMKEFQIRVKDGSKATDEAMKSMSKETQSVWKEFLKGNGAVSDVASTVVAELKTMEDQVLAGQIAVSLFGTKWEDLEADAMYAMLGTSEAMTNFEGKMDEINKIQFSSFSSAIQGIGRILFMDLVYPLGDMVLPYLNKFANYLSNKAALKEYVPIALAIAGAFLTYKGVIHGVATYQKVFNTVQALTPKLLYAQRTAMLAYTFAGGGVKGMITALRSGLAALNLTLLANPFVLAAAAIVALGAAFYGLYQKSETFRTAVAPLVNLVKTEFVAMGQQIKAVFTQMAPLIAEAASTIVPILTNLATMIIPLILQAVQMVFPVILSIIQSVLPIVISLISTVVTTILTLAQNVLPLILSVFSTVFPMILSIVQMVIPIVSTIVQSLVPIIQGIIVPAINGILSVVQMVFPYAQAIIQNALTFINGIITAAMALLRGDWDGAWQAILTTAQTIMNNIISFFSGINLYDVGRAIINGLIDGIKSMAGSIGSAIAGLIPEPIRGAASKLLGSLPGFAEGGVISAPTLAWVGEGGDTEAIIPWNNSQRSKELWLQTGQALGMLNESGAFENMQQQIALKTQANDSFAINPEQVSRSVSNNQSNSTVIHLSYNPQYNVKNPEDLERVKQHADQDKDDLEARIAKLQRDKERTSFGD